MISFLLGCICAAAVAAGVGVAGYLRRGQFARNLAWVASRVREGDLRTRMQPVRSGVEAELAHDVNRMLDALSERYEQLGQERDLLDHVLDHMSTGVLYIDPSGLILMMNRTAGRIFGVDPRDWLHAPHWRVVHPYNLNAAIDEALLFGRDWHQMVTVTEEQVLDFRVVCVSGPGSVGAGDRMRPPRYYALVLCDDVTQRHRLENMRRDFIANVSHELKTPITAIHGFAETLADESLDAETRASFLQIIHEESARMGRLVGDLLTLSRLESQADVLHPVSVRLRDVAEQAVQTVQAQAEKLQLSVGISAGDDVFVTADAEKLHQVFLNLLVNAMHYTPAGGRIDVSWEMDAGKATVHVRDTGIGIPEAHQQRIFERFYRVDRDRSRATGGTGLGLAIVKHIVTAHGGEVGVRSQPGAGSDFWFTLPRRATE